MRNFWVIFKKELAGLFFSPVAYVTTAIITAASSLLFIRALELHVGQEESLVMLLMVSVMVWLPILATVVSMRLFAEEKRSGTLETLMTVAVSEVSVVLGKYFSTLLFVWVAMVPGIGTIYWLAYVSPSINSIDVYGLMGGCIMLGLVSVACVAIGLFVSLLTRNQIVAAIACFTAICVPFFMKSAVVVVPLAADSVVEYLSLEDHLLAFVSGSLSLQVFVLYISEAVLLLFAAVRVLEARRWL